MALALAFLIALLSLAPAGVGSGGPSVAGVANGVGSGGPSIDGGGSTGGVGSGGPS